MLRLLGVGGDLNVPIGFLQVNVFVFIGSDVKVSSLSQSELLLWWSNMAASLRSP